MPEELTSADVREGVRRDGYAVVRNLLTKDEIEALRDALTSHFAHSWQVEGLGKHQPNAVVAIPAMGWLFTHPRILDVFRAICGNPLVFTANCDAHSNMLSWWHKDLGEVSGTCFSGDVFARRAWTVYRAGIYLQDHVLRGGLSVRPGSHHARPLSWGTPETLSTRAGDIVFFDMRLTHAGQFADPLEVSLLRLGRRLRRDPLAAEIGAAYRRLRRRPDKLSVFFTYGSTSPEAAEMCEFELLMKRRAAPGAPQLALALVEALARAGVQVHPALVPPPAAGAVAHSR